jgi:chitinase
LNLAHYCDSTTIDIIPIGFINIFPPKSNGLVAQNFGNQCWNDGNYTSPGYNGSGPNATADFNYGLYTRCPYLQEDIYYCQTQTKKKILLSIGGSSDQYDLNSAADGVYLADFLWGAYGPYNASWVNPAIGHVRPLDRGLYNTNDSMTIDIDGFDFDIEHTSTSKRARFETIYTVLT